MLTHLEEYPRHFVSRIGRCGRCMRLSAFSALAAVAAFAAVSQFGIAGPGHDLAALAAAGLVALWFVHLVAYAGRALARTRRREAGGTGDATVHSRRSALAILARGAGIGVAVSMPVFLASRALAFCGQCSKDDDCGVGYVCRNTAAVNSGTVCNECVAG